MSKIKKGSPRDRMHDLIDSRKKAKKKVKKKDASEPKGDRSIINAWPTKDSFGKAEKVKMDKDEFIKEHKKLVEVLESPSHADDKVEAKKQKKELKEVVSKSEFIDNFKKSYDYRDARVSVDAKDQQAAEETSNTDLVSYIKAGMDSELNKIPLQKGELTLSKKGPGLYSGFYSDEYGQIVEKFDDQTVEMVAKNLELKELYLIPPPSVAPESPNSDDEMATLDQADMIADAHMDHHNATMHGPDSHKGTYVKVKCGDFELEIKKSIHGFVNDFKKTKVTSDGEIKKAVKAWRRNTRNPFRNDLDAAKALLQDWEAHKEEFHQILHVLQQGDDE